MPGRKQVERVTLALADGDMEPTGKPLEYRAVAITPGVGNGRTYSQAVLAASVAAGLWEAQPVHLDHASVADAGRPGGRSVRDLVGCFYGATVREDGAVTGTLRLYRSAEWLGVLIDEVLAAQAHGEPTPPIGLSVDCTIARRGNDVERIVRVHGVDVVMNPARGGHIEGQEATLGEKKVVRDEELGDVVHERIRTAADDTAIEPVALAAQDSADASSDALRAELLDARLKLAGMSDAQAGIVRVALGTDWDTARLDALIAQVRAATVPQVRNLGAIQIQDQADRVQLAADRLFGCSIPDSACDLPRLSGIRELYLMFTGDYDMYGNLYPERAQLANLTTASMTSVVKNALNKRLLETWEMLPRWWAPIVHEEDFTSMQDVTWITMGGFGDLPTVAEGAAYVEQASPSDIEETSSFLKKGGYIGLTMEMIDKDDVAAVRAIPRKLAMAGNRTLASAVSAIFTQAAGLGPTLGQDTTALFDAGHGNLGATALSFTTWEAAITAMFEQAEPVSGKALGIRPRYCLVPIELEKTALEMFRSPLLIGYGGDSNTVSPSTNVRYGGTEVITVPDWTDADNWAAVADPRLFPGICLGYRFGRAPELFVAGDPLVGSMFTNDSMRIKVRFVYTVGIGEYRALYKANV